MTRTLALAAAVCMLCLLWPALGWAHARLDKSVPGRQVGLTSAPSRVQLWFNEPLEGHFCVESEFSFTIRGKR